MFVDLIFVILWMVLSASIYVVLDLFSFSLKRKGWERFVSSFLLFYAQIIGTLFVLGALSVLNTATAVLLNIAVSTAVVYFIHRSAKGNIFAKYKSNFKAIIVGCKKELKGDYLWSALLVVSGVLLGWIVFLGVLFTPTDFDGNSYHLTFVAQTIQSQNFFDFPAALGWIAGYPKGGEFMQLWNVLIARSDVFAELTQIPFLFLGIYALYSISRSVGVDARSARFASLLYLFLPIVLNELKTTYVDVMLCSLFFAAVAMTIKTKLTKLDYVLVGIIYSLLISIKFTGFLFVAATVPFLFWGLYKNRSKKKNKVYQNYILPLLLVFLPTLFGFYWYIKNQVLYGTALHPFGLKIGGVTIFPGKTFQEFAASATSGLKDLPSNCVEKIWFVWTEQKDWYGCLYNYDTNFAGMGPIWFIILLPAVIVSVYFIIKQRNYLYIAVSALILAVFAMYPTNYYSRYTMFIVALGVISLGIVLANIKVIAGNVIKIITIVLSVSVIFMNITLCNFGPGVVKAQILGGIGYTGEGSAYANAFGKAYVRVREVVKPGDVVLYDSHPYFIYPLWNEDYSNKVIYIPAQSELEWEEQLSQKNVKYVFTAVGGKEHTWLSDEDYVTSIYKDEYNEVFEVHKK